jgi:hypothetical protein
MMFTQKEEKPPTITDNKAESPSNNNHQVRAETPTGNEMVALLHETHSKTCLPKGLLIQYLKKCGIEPEKAEEIADNHQMCPNCKVLPKKVSEWLKGI